MLHFVVVLLSLLSIGFVASTSVAAQLACTEAPADVLADRATTTQKEAQAGFSSAMLPGGVVAVMHFTRQIPEAERLVFRAFATPVADLDKDLPDQTYHRLTILGRGESNGQTTLSVAVRPDLTEGFPWIRRYRFRIFACEPSAAPAAGAASTELKFSTIVDKRVTGSPPALLPAVVLVVGSYILLAVFMGSANPLTITRGVTGRASLSNLQILWFSLIVLGVSTYLLARTGELGDLSTDVLSLLGIAALGSAGGKVTASARKRLSWDNYVLLKRMGLELKSPKPASAADLITDAQGQFDVYEFQLLAFSFLVGLALILTGVGGLGDFAIPAGFIGLLGLSQVAYIGGKAIAPPTMADFDKQLSELRELEGKVRADEQSSVEAFQEKLSAVKAAYAGITNINPDADDGLKAAIDAYCQRVERAPDSEAQPDE